MKKGGRTMPNNQAVSILFLLLASFVLVVTSAYGALTMDAGVKGVYEGNINGASSDANKENDFYTIVSAGIGGYTEVSQGAFLFVRGDAASYYYNEYSDLDVKQAGISAGVYKELNDFLSVQIALKGKVKEFKGESRDSNALGGSFEFKQQISPKLWVKEGYEYEKNGANSNLFSYKSHAVGMWTGYLITPQTILNLGYSYLTRKYDDTDGFKTTSHTISAGVVRELLKRVYLNAGYDLQFNDSNIPNTDYTNNIVSIGVTYSY